MSFDCSLAKKKIAEKKLAITVFSFPPDKGNVGTAAYLNVFGSIYRVLQDLKAQGYSIEDVPEKEEDLIKMVSVPTNTNQSMEFYNPCCGARCDSSEILARKHR